MILSVGHIKQVVNTFFDNKPVRKVWLFGSYARGDADESSDVDVLVDIDYSMPLGWDYFTWRDELAKQLNKRVDIVSLGWENKYIKPLIDADKQVIYER
ncbi:MAG: nucleotidyltransferase domain-containing protein [Bacteroidetes bacterium]|nr:nucleotidyltransferase domain-containing protein [Bacteroidota bacterium]